MSRIDISLDGVEPPAWLPRVAPFLEKVLVRLGRPRWGISLLFCGNRRIRELNVRYRGIDEPTDILSFPSGGEDPWPEGAALSDEAGDLVISLDALEENTRFFQVAPDEELRRLLIHGILHLDGMDHATNSTEEPMLQKQEALLEDLAAERILEGA